MNFYVNATDRDESNMQEDTFAEDIFERRIILVQEYKQNNKINKNENFKTITNDRWLGNISNTLFIKCWSLYIKFFL